MIAVLTLILTAALSIFGQIFNTKRDPKNPNEIRYFNKLTPTGWLVIMIILTLLIFSLYTNYTKRQLDNIVKANAEARYEDQYKAGIHVIDSLREQLRFARLSYTRDSIYRYKLDSVMEINYEMETKQLIERTEILRRSLEDSKYVIEDLKSQNDALSHLVSTQTELLLLTALSGDSISPNMELFVETTFDTQWAELHEEELYYDSLYYAKYHASSGGRFLNSSIRNHLFPFFNQDINELYQVGCIVIHISNFMSLNILVFNNGGLLFDGTLYERNNPFGRSLSTILTTHTYTNQINFNIKITQKMSSASLLDGLRKTTSLVEWRLFFQLNESNDKILEELRLISVNIKKIEFRFPYNELADLWYEVKLKLGDIRIELGPIYKVGILHWNVIGVPNLVYGRTFKVN